MNENLTGNFLGLSGDHALSLLNNFTSNLININIRTLLKFYATHPNLSCTDICKSFLIMFYFKKNYFHVFHT